MDITKLQERLKFSKLILGDVRETIADFFENYDPPPIAGVMFDLDYYSSSVAALQIFDADQAHYLPRVYCYFDDIIGTEVELYNDYIGVRLAINEFNQTHKNKKFGKAYHLLTRQVVEPWYHQIFILHDFLHSKYDDFVSEENQQLPTT